MLIRTFVVVMMIATSSITDIVPLDACKYASKKCFNKGFLQGNATVIHTTCQNSKVLDCIVDLKECPITEIQNFHLIYFEICRSVGVTLGTFQHQGYTNNETDSENNDNGYYTGNGEPTGTGFNGNPIIIPRPMIGPCIEELAICIPKHILFNGSFGLHRFCKDVLIDTCIMRTFEKCPRNKGIFKYYKKACSCISEVLKCDIVNDLTTVLSNPVISKTTMSTFCGSLPDIRKCMKDNFNKCPHEVYVGLITSVSKVERACPYSDCAMAIEKCGGKAMTALISAHNELSLSSNGMDALQTLCNDMPILSRCIVTQEANLSCPNSMLNMYNKALRYLQFRCTYIPCGKLITNCGAIVASGIATNFMTLNPNFIFSFGSGQLSTFCENIQHTSKCLITMDSESSDLCNPVLKTLSSNMLKTESFCNILPCIKKIASCGDKLHQFFMIGESEVNLNINGNVISGLCSNRDAINLCILSTAGICSPTIIHGWHQHQDILKMACSMAKCSDAQSLCTHNILELIIESRGKKSNILCRHREEIVKCFVQLKQYCPSNYVKKQAYEVDTAFKYCSYSECADRIQACGMKISYGLDLVTLDTKTIGILCLQVLKVGRCLKRIQVDRACDRHVNKFMDEKFRMVLNMCRRIVQDLGLQFKNDTQIPGMSEEKPDRSKPDRSKPDQSKPDRSKPDGSKPDRSKPDSNKPDRNKPGGSKPDGKKPDGSKPGGNKPDGKKPGGNKPGGNKPGGSKPDGKKPGGNKPNGSKPDGKKPGGNKPDGSKPGGNKPDGSKPDGKKPGGNKPGGNKSDGSKPDGNKPDRSKPDGKKPGGNKPDGSKPDGNKPDGSKPGGNKPDESKPDGRKPDGKKSDGKPGKRKMAISIRLKLKWKKVYENLNSTESKEIVRNIEGSLTNVYKDTPGFKYVTVTRLFESSIGVDHTVEYENDITDQLVTTIAKTLQDGTSRGIVIGNTLADVVGNPEMIIEGNSVSIDDLCFLHRNKNLCLNMGTCMVTMFGPECQCANNYQGTFCQYYESSSNALTSTLCILFSILSTIVFIL